MKRIWIWLVAALILIVLGLFGGMLWWASSQLLFPSWQGGGDLNVCKEETAMVWGEQCGNLRDSREFVFNEVSIPGVNGFKLPGWLVKADENGFDTANGAVMIVHGGGSDRRESTRYIGFFLEHNFDVLTFDLGCHGEAPCPVPGLSYGQRESEDVFSAYSYLLERYDNVYAKGFSVGAASVLTALPHMQGLDGAIVVNPYLSFDRLIRDAPEAESAPEWFLDAMISLAMKRGKFDGNMSPEQTVQLVNNTPVFFIHSRRDEVTPYRHSEKLAELYRGPLLLWLPDYGSHSTIRDTDPEQYENRIRDFMNSL
jgi:uncharacterized protein